MLNSKERNKNLQKKNWPLITMLMSLARLELTLEDLLTVKQLTGRATVGAKAKIK